MKTNKADLAVLVEQLEGFSLAEQRGAVELAHEDVIRQATLAAQEAQEGPAALRIAPVDEGSSPPPQTALQMVMGGAPQPPSQEGARGRYTSERIRKLSVDVQEPLIDRLRHYAITSRREMRDLVATAVDEYLRVRGS